MVRQLPLVLLLALTSLGLSAQNIDFVGNLTYPDRLSDIWGWTSSTGHEYALVGVWDGLSIVDVSTDPTNPTEIAFYGGPPSTWRDMKTWGDYAYMIHDGTADGSPGQGLLIVDMITLDTVTIRNFGPYTITTTHNIFIDEFGYAYLCGGNHDAVGGVLILDLNVDPWNPSYVANYDVNYVHDLFVRDNIMWTAEIYTGAFAAVDVSDKASMTVLATQTSPTLFTHNVWLSDDDQILFTTDEVNDGYIGAYDVSDLSDISETDAFLFDPGSATIPHNTFVYGDHIVTSHYTAGVIVHDISDPNNLVQVGRYDTSPFEGGDFSGCWGVYPYALSGYIYATDIETGFYVLDPTYVSASYLQGNVTEVGSGTAINGAEITIVGSGATGISDISGNYATGLGETGTYDLAIFKEGYEAQTVTGVSLAAGTTTTVDVELTPLASFTLNATVVEAGTATPIPNAEVALISTDGVYRFEATSDGVGAFSLSSVYELEYDIVGAKWGYRYELMEAESLNGSSPLVVELEQGYEDDFELDLGWVSTGATWAGGAWEQGNPQPFDPGYGYPITAASDVDGDIGTQAYVTGNGSPIDLVHADAVRLISPAFDGRIFTDPVLEFSAFVFNTDTSGLISNDGLVVQINISGTTTPIDTIYPDGPGTPTWREFSYHLSDFVSMDAEMKVVFVAEADGTPFFISDVLEAGVDAFVVKEFEDSSTGIEEPTVITERVFPNPAQDQVNIQLDGLSDGAVTLTIYGITGKRMSAINANLVAGQLSVDASELKDGVYLYEVSREASRVATGKFSVAR